MHSNLIKLWWTIQFSKSDLVWAPQDNSIYLSNKEELDDIVKWIGGREGKVVNGWYGSILNRKQQDNRMLPDNKMFPRGKVQLHQVLRSQEPTICLGVNWDKEFVVELRNHLSL